MTKKKNSNSRKSKKPQSAKPSNNKRTLTRTVRTGLGSLTTKIVMILALCALTSQKHKNLLNESPFMKITDLFPKMIGNYKIPTDEYVNKYCSFPGSWMIEDYSESAANASQQFIYNTTTGKQLLQFKDKIYLFLKKKEHVSYKETLLGDSSSFSELISIKREQIT